MSTIIEAEYLYNDTGNHDKVYNIAIKEDHRWAAYGSGGYEVIAEWGPRLGVLKSQVKYSGNSRVLARLEFDNLVKAKRNKGYRSINESASTRTRLTNVPIPNKPHKPKKPAKPIEPVVEPYNPDYIPERRLDDEL